MDPQPNDIAILRDPPRGLYQAVRLQYPAGDAWAVRGVQLDGPEDVTQAGRAPLAAEFDQHRWGAVVEFRVRIDADTCLCVVRTSGDDAGTVWAPEPEPEPKPTPKTRKAGK